MSDVLLPYGEMAETLDRLPLLVKEARRARGLGLRGAADLIGTTAPTLQRLESGRPVSSRLAPKVLRWLADRTVA